MTIRCASLASVIVRIAGSGRHSPLIPCPYTQSAAAAYPHLAGHKSPYPASNPTISTPSPNLTIPPSTIRARRPPLQPASAFVSLGSPFSCAM